MGALQDERRRVAPRRCSDEPGAPLNGGAPLLGVRQIVVIGHGSSNARAIRNAIRSAKEFSENRASERIESGIAEISAAEKLMRVARAG